MAQARGLNKIQYGVTVNGPYPDPEEDNGSGLTRPKSQTYWGKLRTNPLAINKQEATNFKIEENILHIDLRYKEIIKFNPAQMPAVSLEEIEVKNGLGLDYLNYIRNHGRAIAIKAH